MAEDPNAVVAHYQRNNLLARIQAALSAAGQDPAAPSRDALSGLDHLHGGGLATTIVQADLAGISRGSHVLDAGCGIGGPSRYLADAYGCTVDAIDLTPEYVDVAAHLNDLVGLSDQIRVVVGSVTDLPYDDARFDAVMCQNVTMNVSDKAAMFSEAFRTLKPGGIYTISHVAEGPQGGPIYPLPWAMDANTSFLGQPNDVLDALRTAGFEDVRDRMADARSNPGGTHRPDDIGPAPAMGDDMPQRLSNVVQSMEEARLVPMLIVARKG